MIKAILGLGNPGHQFYYTRHNIGFRIINTLAEHMGAGFKSRKYMELAQVFSNSQSIVLIKPMTFMNNSGKVMSYLTKQGIGPANILVIHDELELPFGKIAFKQGGSAKGHNGLKSIIQVIGDDFWRLRFGIGRPTSKEEVPHYVLALFNEPADQVEYYIQIAANMIQEHLSKNS